MRIRFIVFGLLFVTLLGSCNCKENLKSKSEELENVKKELKDCQNVLSSTHDKEIYLPVSLDKLHNNKFQLVHIEGNYGIPYLILAKFKTGKRKNGKCQIKTVKLKIKSIDGAKYVFEKEPVITVRNGIIYSDVKIVIGSDTSNSERTAKIPVKITASDQQIFDLHFLPSEELDKYFDGFQENDQAILCCNGVICKSKLEVPNP